MSVFACDEMVAVYSTNPSGRCAPRRCATSGYGDNRLPRRRLRRGETATILESRLSEFRCGLLPAPLMLVTVTSTCAAAAMILARARHTRRTDTKKTRNHSSGQHDPNLASLATWRMC